MASERNLSHLAPRYDSQTGAIFWPDLNLVVLREPEHGPDAMHAAVFSHEMEHYYRINSTPWGVLLFENSYRVAVQFLHLLEKLRETSQPLIVPIEGSQRDIDQPLLELYRHTKKLQVRYGGFPCAFDGHVQYPVFRNDRLYVPGADAIIEGLGMVAESAVLDSAPWKERYKSCMANGKLWRNKVGLQCYTELTKFVDVDTAILLLDLALWLDPNWHMSGTSYIQSQHIGHRLISILRYVESTKTIGRGRAAVDRVCSDLRWRSPNELIPSVRRYKDQGDPYLAPGLMDEADVFIFRAYHEWSELVDQLFDHRAASDSWGPHQFIEHAKNMPIYDPGRGTFKFGDRSIDWVLYWAFLDIIAQLMSSPSATLRCPLEHFGFCGSCGSSPDIAILEPQADDRSGCLAGIPLSLLPEIERRPIGNSRRAPKRDRLLDELARLDVARSIEELSDTTGVSMRYVRTVADGLPLRRAINLPSGVLVPLGSLSI